MTLWTTFIDRVKPREQGPSRWRCSFHIGMVLQMVQNKQKHCSEDPALQKHELSGKGDVSMFTNTYQGQPRALPASLFKTSLQTLEISSHGVGSSSGTAACRQSHYLQGKQQLNTSQGKKCLIFASVMMRLLLFFKQNDRWHFCYSWGFFFFKEKKMRNQLVVTVRIFWTIKHLGFYNKNIGF